MDFIVSRHVVVQARDGTSLVGDIYVPELQKRHPSILFRTPYGRDDERFRKYAKFFASNGIAFLNFDVRGRGDSDGSFRPYVSEGKDGYDLIEWASRQPWSDGNIGTFGASYSARIQWLTALEKPEHLRAMISIVSPSDPFVESPTGVNDPMHISWRYLVSGRTLKSTDDIDWDSVYKTLPLKDMPNALGISFPDWNEDLEHQTYDSYWDRIGYQNRFPKIDVPTLHISGWYDDEQIGTFINYVGMRNRSASKKSRENQAIIIGPWGHRVNSTSKLGEVDFGPTAMIDLEYMMLEWYRKWLIDPNVKTGSRARMFIMGMNEWVEFDDWPPSTLIPRNLYLTSGGKANSRLGDGILVSSIDDVLSGEDGYIYDPSNPTPFVTEITSSQIGGPDNYSSVERRDDVLVYSTSPFDREFTILGEVYANLFVSTNVKDTDVMAMLLDVWPNGFTQRLCDGMVRMRYRNGMERTELLEEGRIYGIKINMWNTGHRFLKGHRLRLQISSAAFPKYSRNLNTGLDIANDATVKVANTRVIHTGQNPSSLSVYEYE